MKEHFNTWNVRLVHKSQRKTWLVRLFDSLPLHICTAPLTSLCTLPFFTHFLCIIHFPILTLVTLSKLIQNSFRWVKRLYHSIMVKRQLDFSIDNDSSNGNDTDYQTINGRRVLRSRYLAVKNVINGGNSILFNGDSVFWFFCCALQVWYRDCSCFLSSSLIVYGYAKTILLI